ncbi:MAG: tRNA glutamyl-Q synthetase [Flaviaesturariibacter sp.]|nr:tRNA glutamyl-Q synthetase [Flaviaesturariibacter sp.]
MEGLTPTPVARFAKTRLAPTPSGYLHAGNVLSFLLTERLARQTGARILLRIDDGDTARVRPAYVQHIFDTLAAINVHCDEGPRDAADLDARWSQRHRAHLYSRYLDALRAGNHVYACTCSRADVLRESADGTYSGRCRHRDLPLDTVGASWRLNTDTDLVLEVRQLDGTVSVERLPVDMHDVVVRKKDGMPSYQLSSIADDVYFGVDLVVRGQDLWPSTLVQLYIARLLSLDAFAAATFVHHPLLKDDDGAKLSKSTGAAPVDLRTAGREALMRLLNPV